MKTQVIIERKSKKILDVGEAKGSVHDFHVYKDTIGKDVRDSILIQADLGYLGIEKLHKNSRIPKKESKPHKLNKQEKAYNKRLARERVVIEHINAKIKTFKSMAYPYRNHCRRHLLRMSLICGIINWELCF
ncbi:MAG: transposase [Treponema sp.]|nr:transposase [Treponema sp.]